MWVKMLTDTQDIDRMHRIVRDMRIVLHAPGLTVRERKLFGDMISAFDEFERNSVLEEAQED